MSTTIDNKVVEMRFDNQHFEKNVSTTMSSLDKLKEKLNFKDAAKGLDGVNASVKKVDVSSLGEAATQVGLKFNAMYTMADQALRNITNSAMAAGKRIVNALTIDPIKTGLQEYETQINSVQTILANTKSKGSTIDDVNKALDELNAYADLTIYNFTEMTRNIGTFTAAGIDLETSVNAIQGIANLAAVSGSTSQQASTAMYQLSQALASGTVKLMDWNSVVNAGMGGQVFQDALKETSELLGTGAEAAIKAQGSFRESLTTGWLTADVLTETLKKFTTSGANEYVAKYTGLSVEAVQATLESAKAQYGEAEAIDQAAKALAEKSGKNEQEIKQALEFAKTAEDAATKVKTFSQMWDVIKESVQSGWSQTWELIFGDFEQAKALFTPLTNFFTNIIGKMSDARNKLLKGALGSPFAGLVEKIQKVNAGVESAVKTVKDYEKVVNEIISGKWGNGQSRWDKLTEAGYDWAHAQNLVNERLGVSLRRTTNYKESQDELQKTQTKTIDQLVKMSDAQLKEAGYTQEQIDALRLLEKEADKLGMPIEEFVKQVDKLDGRTLLINSFKNAGQGLVTIFKAIGDAWRDAFPPMQSETLYNIIAAIHKFSTNLVVSKDTAEKLTRTLKGVFAILDIITTLTGKAFKVGVQVIKTLLEALGFVDVDILSVTAVVGDAIVAFRDWLDTFNPITKAIEFIVPLFVKFGKAVADFVKEVYNMDGVQKAVHKVKDTFSDIGKSISKYFGPAIDVIKRYIENFKKLDSIELKDFTKAIKAIGGKFKEAFESLPDDIWSGFIKGIKDGAKSVFSAISTFFTEFIAKAKEVLGIHSPSRVFMAIGTFVVLGLIKGIQHFAPDLWATITETLSGMFGKASDTIQNGVSSVVNFLQNAFTKVSDFFGGLDFGKMLVAGTLVGTLVIFNKLANALNTLVSPLENFGDFIDTCGESLTRVTKAFSQKAKSEALLNIAKAIGILAASLAILSLLDQTALWSAAGALIAITLVMTGLLFVVNKMKDIKDIGKLAVLMLGVSVGLSILASAVKKLASIEDPTKAWIAIGQLGAILGGIAVFLAIYGSFVKGKAAQNIDKAALLIWKIASTIAILAIVIKMISGLEWGDIGKGAAVIAGAMVLCSGLVFVSKYAGKHADKAGTMLLKMSIAIGILAIAIKMIAGMEWGDIGKGAAVLAGVMVLFGILIAVSKLAGEHADKAGTMLLKMSLAITILAIAIKMIADISQSDVDKGMGVIEGIFELFLAFIVVSKLCGENASKAGSMLLKMSAAMLILAITVKFLGTISLGDIIMGGIVIAAFGTMMLLLVNATKNAGANASIAGSMLLKMSAAILILVGAIALLSLLKVEDVLLGAAVITVFMGMFALLLYTAQFAAKSMGPLIVMTTAITLLIAGIALLSFLDVDKVKIATGCIAALIGMFTLLVGVSALATSSMGTLIVLTVAITMLGIILYKLAELPVESVMGSAIALGGLLLAMSAALGILALVGLAGPAALVGIGSLLVLIGAVGLVVSELGKLSDKAVALIDKGIPVLEKIGIAIGSFFGGIVNGFATGASKALPEIGSALGQFMTNAMPFIEGIKMVDASMLEGIGVLAGAVLALTAADLVSGIASFISGSGSFAQLGIELSQFMMNAMPFIAGASLLNGDMMTGVKALAETVLILTAADVVNGLTSWLTGGNSLSSFGSELGKLGSDLASFVANLGTFTEAQVTTVSCAGKAIKAIAEAAATIPNDGGLWGAIVGENGLSSFSSKLPQLGTDISGFITNLGTFDESKVTTVDCAGKAIKALAEAANAVPNEGGLWGAIVGENSLSTFSGALPQLGTDLASFVSNLGTFDESTITTVDCAGKAIKALAEAANTIPNEGGLWASLVGDNSLATFSAQLPGLGTDLASFIENLGSFDESKIATVDCARRALVSLAGLGKIDLVAMNANVGVFGTKIIQLAKDLKTFIETMSKVTHESIDSVTKKIEKLISLATEVNETKVDGLKNFSDSLAKVGKDGVKGFSSAFTESDSITKVQNAAKKIVKEFIKAVKDQKENVGDAFEVAAKAGFKAIKTKEMRQDFYDAGVYLVEGFAEGITDTTYAAEVAAEAMANAAKKAAEEALDENSPSKEFYKIGAFAGQGLVNALGDYSSNSYDAGYSMADSAKRGLSNAISKVRNFIDSGMDMQPTIRPVLDLTDVESGVGTLGSMLNMGSHVGVMANVGSISAMMSGNQNGVNDDVVSAINRLRKDLGKVGNTTSYNINGVSADGDSAVADAIQTIVRAATMGRRT